MRHGLLFIGAAPLHEIVETAVAAEADGLDGVYCVEAYRSAFVPLAAIAAATTRIQLGPYILNAYSRTPYIAGMSAIDLDELSQGRLVIGVGPGNVHINRDYQGLETDKPLTKMREYVELMQQIVRTPLGGEVRYEGKQHRMHWEPHAAPLRPSIPVWMSAISPKMVSVAGSIADAVAMGVLLSPEYVRDRVRPGALAAAEMAGRDPASLEFTMGALVAVDDDIDRARLAIKTTIAGFYHPIPHPYYDFLLREQGFERAADACTEFAGVGRMEEAIARIDDEVIDTLAIVGTPAQCAERLGSYEGLIDEVLFLNVGGADAATMCEAHRPVMAIKGATKVHSN